MLETGDTNPEQDPNKHYRREKSKKHRVSVLSGVSEDKRGTRLTYTKVRGGRGSKRKVVIPKDELFQKGSPKKILTFLRLKGRRLVGGSKVSFLGKEGGTH